jgi:type IV secretory pathway VirD2 relaxase
VNSASAATSSSALHRGLTERGIERATASYVLAGESLDVPVVGRLVDRGLDDELKGTWLCP